jgi:GH25 family lysozyme M1 (1,4-beta-N-acetylmuramidase)
MLAIDVRTLHCTAVCECVCVKAAKKIDVFDKLFCKYTYSLYNSRWHFT